MTNFDTIKHPGGREQPRALITARQEHTRRFFVDANDPDRGPVHHDIPQGSGGHPHAVLTGEAHAIEAGQAVCVNASASSPDARLLVQTFEGSAWGTVGDFLLPSIG